MLSVEQILTLATSVGTLATLFGKIWMDIQNNRDRIARNEHVVAKIAENTTISKEAFAVANHVNEKIATVAERAARGEAAAATAQRADQHAVSSMDGVMREMAELRAMTQETHRLLNERAPAATNVIVAVADAPKPDAA